MSEHDPTMASNCGLPDGVVHQHAERCYQAGYDAGRAAAIEEFRVLVRPALDVVRHVWPAFAAAAKHLGVKTDA